MTTINETLELFTDELRKFGGAIPTFKIDYANDEIIIVDACSGFLKRVFENKKASCSLHGGVMILRYFK